MDDNSQSLPMVFNDPTIPFFDLAMVVENAKEIHVMQTSFMDFINAIPIAGTIFRHQYVRNYPDTHHTQGVNEIHEIKRWRLPKILLKKFYR